MAILAAHVIKRRSGSLVRVKRYVRDVSHGLVVWMPVSGQSTISLIYDEVLSGGIAFPSWLLTKSRLRLHCVTGSERVDLTVILRDGIPGDCVEGTEQLETFYGRAF